MTTFHLLNFGCRASQADGAALKRQLIETGFQEVQSPEQSQIAVLNTCTVTAAADAEVRQVIRRIHRANPQCRIAVTGCYAQRTPQEIVTLPGVVWVVGNSHRHLIAGLLRDSCSGGFIPPRDGLAENRARVSGAGRETSESPAVLVGEITQEFHFAPVFPNDHTRPTLKIQDGCDARCSFCIIPQVRGPSRSLQPDKVIEQVRELEAGGYKEIVISGINLGSYAKDLGRRITLLGLLERILAESAIARVRISSVETMDVTPQLINLVATEPRMAQHFHVPLQSGSDRILRLMNRRYWARQYAERIVAIHERVPNCGIGADVMVGFPGETAQDHETNLRFIESLPFTYLHIFPYSARPGTRAAASPDQLNGRVIRERSRELRAIIAAKRRAFLEAQVGRRLSAITLDESAEGDRIALTSNYLKVALPGAEVPPNQIHDILILRAVVNILTGRIG